MAVNSTLIKTVFNFLKSEKAKETKTKKIRQIACSHNDRPSRTNYMVITGSFNYHLLHVYCMHDFSLEFFYSPNKQTAHYISSSTADGKLCNWRSINFTLNVIS